MAGTTRGSEQAWWALLLDGIAAVLLGVYALTVRPGSIAALVIAIALYWFVRGVVEIAEVSSAPRLRRGPRFLAAIVSILGGAFVLAYPMFGALPQLVILALPLLGAVALVSGVSYLAHGVMGGGGGSTILGVYDLMLAAVILGQVLVPALILRLGVEIVALIGGAIIIGVAFALRTHQHSPMHRVAPA